MVTDMLVVMWLHRDDVYILYAFESRATDGCFSRNFKSSLLGARGLGDYFGIGRQKSGIKVNNM